MRVGFMAWALALWLGVLAGMASTAPCNGVQVSLKPSRANVRGGQTFAVSVALKTALPPDPKMVLKVALPQGVSLVAAKNASHPQHASSGPIVQGGNLYWLRPLVKKRARLLRVAVQVADCAYLRGTMLNITAMAYVVESNWAVPPQCVTYAPAPKVH